MVRCVMCLQDFHDVHAFQAFSRYDENKDGHVTALQFHDIMTRLKSHLLTDFVRENLVTVGYYNCFPALCCTLVIVFIVCLHFMMFVRCAMHTLHSLLPRFKVHVGCNSLLFSPNHDYWLVMRLNLADGYKFCCSAVIYMWVLMMSWRILEQRWSYVREKANSCH